MVYTSLRTQSSPRRVVCIRCIRCGLLEPGNRSCQKNSNVCVHMVALLTADHHGEEIVQQLGAAGYAVLVKLHDRSRDPTYVNSGGLDGRARLEPLLRSAGTVLAAGGESCRTFRVHSF